MMTLQCYMKNLIKPMFNDAEIWLMNFQVTSQNYKIISKLMEKLIELM